MTGTKGEIYIEETVKFNHIVQIEGVSNAEIDDFIDEYLNRRIDSVDEAVQIITNKYGDKVTFVGDTSGYTDEIEIE